MNYELERKKEKSNQTFLRFKQFSSTEPRESEKMKRQLTTYCTSCDKEWKRAEITFISIDQTAEYLFHEIVFSPREQQLQPSTFLINSKRTNTKQN
jgi:hypothetical protein